MNSHYNGEPKRDSKGRFVTPDASIVPVLKNEALLTSKLGIDIDPTAPPIIETMGIENFNFQDELKSKMGALENEVKSLETLYL